NAECRMQNCFASNSAFCILHSAFCIHNLAMQDIRGLFADYAAYHQTRGNKWFHRVGIPLIMISLLGLLTNANVTVGGLRVDLAMLLIVAAEVVYLMLDWRLGAVMLVVSVGFYP